MAGIRASEHVRLLLSAGVLLCSCARTDHQADLQQASEAAQNATGIPISWKTQMELAALQLHEGKQLTLEAALNLALSNNRKLRADMEVIAQARADLVQAGLLSNPVLSFAGMLPEGGGRADLTFGLSKDIAEIWLIPSRKRAADAMLQQRILSFVDSAIGLVSEVRTNYYTLQYQTQAIELQEKNLQILRDVIELSQARLRAGEAGQLDLYLARGRLLETELELIQMRSESQLTRKTLLRLMGIADANDRWEPTSAETKLVALVTEEQPIVEAALRQRLDVQAARWEVDSALAEFDQQRLRVIPMLNIGPSGERYEARALPGRNILADTARASVAAGQLTAPEIESRGQRNIERSQIIDMVLGPMIEVPIPIFDQNRAQMAKAQARARELLQRSEETQQRVVEGVRSALTRRKLAEDRVRLFQQSLLPVQQSSLDIARSTYQAGRETIVAVLLAQESLIRARLNYLASVRDMEMATASLERELSGKLPPELLSPLTSQPAH